MPTVKFTVHGCRARRGPRLRLAALAAAMQHSESVCQIPPKLQDAGYVKALRLARHDTSSLTALTTVTDKQHTVTMLKLTTVTPQAGVSSSMVTVTCFIQEGYVSDIARYGHALEGIRS
jgi:hypothetical protein